jgi:D-alanyl-D-alanine carboxypeptidase/D-alanyl-D-alanine-endopeptidase (penicillin-binding protein 4)
MRSQILVGLAWLAVQAAAPAGAVEPAGSLDARRDDGAVLYAQAPDRALVPASNAKVLTALGALDAFGPTHRFTTRIYGDAGLDAEGTVGTLFVRGGGDPVLNSEDWWRLAADLRRIGLRGVRGDIVLDDSAFDRARWHPDWRPVSSRAYHAPIGALSANYGAFAVEVRPGKQAGEAARVTLDPPVAYLRLSNRALTAASGAGRSLAVDRKREADHERVVVTGRVPLGSEPEVIWRSVADPARYAGSVLRLQLEANGIHVAGSPREGDVPEAAQELLAFEGRPLAEIVRLFLKYSSNPIGESLIKALGSAETGRPGSWTTGLAALRRRLVGLGFDASAVSLEDGSGLSYENRLSPRTLVRALRAGASSFDFGPEYVAAFPISARDGTLEKRVDGARGALRAKTGLLNRVTGLCGYARASDGGEMVFSILVNGYRGTDKQAMDAVDAFVERMVRVGVLGSAESDALPQTEIGNRLEVVPHADGG